MATAEAAPPDLAAENERLRKENQKLSRELGQMKNLCSNIYVLMSKYAGGGGGARTADVEAPSAEMELFPARLSSDPEEKGEADASPKLFGFPIRTKRVRQEEGDGDGEEEEEEKDPTAKGEVKSEPDTETGTDPKDDEAGPGSWSLYYSRPTCNR